MKKNLTAFALLIFMFINVSYAQTWWYVNDNSTSNDLYTLAIGNNGNAGTQAAPFATINHAISVAAVDDIIVVDAGTYIENVVVNKRLDIRGAQPEHSIIEATNANATPLIFAASGASVQGFTLTHNYTPAELAAWNFNNNGVTFNQGTSASTLSNCTITLNRNGIYLNTTQNNIITNCSITNNRTGINMTGNINGNQISSNTISDNWTIGIVSYAPTNPGSNLTDYSTVIVNGNTFSNNWYSEVLVKDASAYSGTLNVTNNTFTDSPVTYSTSSSASLNEPAFENQKPVALGGTAVKPTEDLPTLRIYNSGSVGLRYDNPKTVLVEAGQSIQSAINFTTDGDIIQIAAGIYDHGVSTLTVNKSLTFIGAGPASSPTTIITSTASRIITLSATGKSFSFQNLMIEGNTSNNGIYAGSSIDINSLSMQDVVLRNCQVGLYLAENYPGGGPLTTTVSSLSFNNVTLTNNKFIGAYIGKTVLSGTITNSTITGNGYSSDLQAAWQKVGLQFVNFDEASVPHVEITNCYFYNNGAGASDIERTGLSMYTAYNALSTNELLTVSASSFVNHHWAVRIKNEYSVGNTATINGTFSGNDLDIWFNSVIGNSSSTTLVRRTFPGIRTVGAGPTYDYNTIQAAINAASSGEIINVSAGLYTETISINKPLTITGAGNTTTIIDGSDNGIVVNVTSNNVNLSGFTVRNSGLTGVEAGIALNGVNGCNISNNIISDNFAGVALVASTSNIISNNILSANYFGVYLGNTTTPSTGNAISGNTITGSIAVVLAPTLNTGDGIYADQNCNNNTYLNNTIQNNGKDGIYFWKSSSNTVTGNTISGNTSQGIQLMGSANNIFTGNSVVNNNDNGFKIRSSGWPEGAYPSFPNTINENNIHDNSNYDVIAEAQVDNVNAEGNWWGSTSPDFANIVSGNVDYSPWLGQQSDDPHDEENPWTWYVNDETDVTEVINNANDEDIVVFINGSYDHITINKPITLIGNGSVISNASPAITVTADNVTITGFVFVFNDNTIPYDDYAIDVQNNATNIVINQCNFQNLLNGATGNGVINRGTGTVDARYNYWNDATGPTIASNPLGTGTIATNLSTGTLLYFPWYIDAGRTTLMTGGVTLISPANYSVGVSVLPQFTWSSISDAASFDLEISVDGSSWTTIMDNVYTTTFTLAEFNQLSSGVLYYWRVRINGGLLDGVYSATREFTTNNGQVTITTYYPYGTSASLAWYLLPASANVKYDIYYSVNSNMSGYNVIPDLTNTSYTLTNLLAGTQYYVLVKAKNNAGTVIINYSDIVTFTTEGIAQPNLTYPVAGAVTYSNPPYLYWYAGNYNSSVEYEVKYWTNAAGEPADGIYVAQGASQGYFETNSADQYVLLTAALTPGVTYNWKVRTKTGTIAPFSYSAWSSTETFMIYNSVPAAAPTPNLSWPVGGAISYINPPSLYWYTGTYTTGVYFEVEWSNNNFSTVLGFQSNITDLFYTLNTSLSPGTYYWRVRSKVGIGGTYGSWSAIATFVIPSSVSYVSVPYPTEPVGTTVVSLNPTMNWFAVTPPALQYKVRISPYSSTDGNGRLNHATATETGWISSTSSAFNSLTFSPSITLVAGATYYWQVQARLAASPFSESGWSYVASFNTAAGSFAIVPLVGSPSHGQPINSTSAMLSWVLPQQNETHLKYDVEYSKESDFSNSFIIKDVNEKIINVEGLEPHSTYYWRVLSKNSNGSASAYSETGSFTTSTVTDVEEEKIPIEFSLEQNYPNPFNPTTRISYSLPQNSFVTLKIYDMLGREVRTLVNQNINAGKISVDWNGDDNFGMKVSSGAYIYRIIAGDFVATKKMLLIK